MAFSSGIIHLAQLYVYGNLHSHRPKKATPPPAKEKSPERIVQTKLEEQRQLQGPKSCLKMRSVSPNSGETTPNGRKVHFILSNAHKARQDKGDITTLDLSTAENLETIIYPACMNWTIEMYLGKGKEETHSTVAWEAFRYIVSNYSSFPKRSNPNKENRIMARLCAQGAELLAKNQKALGEMAKKILEYPQLFPTFDALIPFVDPESYYELLEDALSCKNLKVLKSLLDFDSVPENRLKALSWKEVALDCLEERPCDPLFAKIANYLKPEEQLEFLDQFFSQSRWDGMAMLCQSDQFATTLKDGNQKEEYDEKLKEIAKFCTQDSQYFPLLESILSFIKPEHYRALADNARKHGNTAANQLLLGIPAAPPKARVLFPWSNIG